MAIINTSQNLSEVSYTRGEIIEIINGATVTINSSLATRPGTIQCITSGKLRIENSSSTVPLLLDLDDMNNDLRFEAGGILEIRGAPMSLGTGTGAAQSFDFTSLFGGVIKTLTYCEIEETAGSGRYLPWPIINEDPKFQLNTGVGVVTGGASDTAFTAGNTRSGRVLFWHETNRTLRCGDGTNGGVIPSGCAIRIPNIYISNRHLTNATRIMAIATTGTPTGGTFTLEISNEAGTVLGTTAAIAFNATAAAIDTAIEAVTGASTVTSAGGPLPAAVSITWAGSLVTGFGNIPSVRIANNSLTGGTNPQVELRENATSNMTLIDLNPLGTMDCEWVSFSHKIRPVISNFTALRLINVGFGSDSFTASDSNGTYEIDGVSSQISPFVSNATSSVATIYGSGTIKRWVSVKKLPTTTNIQTLPLLQSCDRVFHYGFGARTATSNRGLQLVTLPTGLKITNTASIGASYTLQNLTNPVIVNPEYADGVGSVQIATNAMSVFVLSNVINPVIANLGSAGPQQLRSLLINIDPLSSGVQFYGGGFDFANNGDRPIFLAGGDAIFQNMSFPNVRSGPMIDNISTWLAKNARIKKVFATFATAQLTNGLDACTGGQYDLVTSGIAGITETFAGVGDFVGGNYTEASLTPTTGHVTFGPFGSGQGLTLTGAAFTNALGGFLLQNSGDTAEITMTFAMHGITSFQNVEPYLFADIPGAIANVGIVGAPSAPTGGTFTISVFDSSNTLLGTTSALAFNASTTTVDSAIEAIAGVGTGVGVSGSLTTGYIITFPIGQLRRVTVDGSLLTGGTNPGIAFAVGRVRLLTGTELLGSVNTHEFACRVPGTPWPAYQTLTGSNLSGAISALTGYAAGGSGLEMRLKITHGENNPFTTYNQISLPTNVDPTLWTVNDASFNLQGPSSTDIVKVLRSSDDTVLYTFTGSGVKEFVVGANFDVDIYFSREDSLGNVLMKTRPATQKISFGNNGNIALFYGAEVQLAESSDVATMKAVIDAIKTKVDILENTNLNGLEEDLVIINNGVKKASLLIPHNENLL